MRFKSDNYDYIKKSIQIIKDLPDRKVYLCGVGNIAAKIKNILSENCICVDKVIVSDKYKSCVYASWQSVYTISEILSPPPT
jgi:hypothetical protein